MAQHLFTLIGLSLAVAVPTATPTIAQAADPTKLVAIQAAPTMKQSTALSAEATQLAEQLNIMGSIDELNNYRVKPANNANEFKILQLKQSITQAVLVSMLEVRSAASQIAYDIFEAGQLRNFLEQRRDRQIKFNSVANFVSGGIAEIMGGALQLSPNVRIQGAGNISEIVGGGVQTGLSTLALRQQMGENHRCIQQPNMLAPIFDLAAAEPRYPHLVWQFINLVAPGANDTRRSLLIKEWLHFGRLKTTKNHGFLCALTGCKTTGSTVTIDMLEDRQVMLSDVNALVSQIEKNLLEILLYSEIRN